MTPAIRMQTVEEYYFSTKREEIATLEQQGFKIINLGIGNPDLPTHPDVIAKLEQTARENGSNYYQPYKGIPELRNAFKKWYQKIYNVNLQADKHILPLAGSKEAIMHIHMAFCDPGDEILVPNPGYPSYSSTAKLLQVNIKHYNITEENNWQPNMEELKKLLSAKTKILWVNYPHMPTGANADSKTLQQLIRFAIEHNLLIVNDNPYSFILNSSPKSILSCCEESDPVIELNSLSKSHNMAGWRVGVAVGNDQILEEVLKVKSNFDSGMFKPIQKAAIKALELDEKWFDEINEEYSFRKVLIHDLLDKLNCEFESDTAGLFIWAKIPSKFENGEAFSNYLLHEKGIFASPGHIFGSNGDQYIRFSLCANQKDIIESRNRIVTEKMSV
jgi:aspartate/methionine/tyrosine aminotransferase